ncbi:MULTISPECIES: LTA synthase family protein [unclassified Flavobacterium]|uniref:LTA synthase family protein n=1 Tax=unclassified Flavobacterium TaxID=196869 RepID=UPI001F13F0B7|nr:MULTISPECIES: alkaline phosphatase family protein [unclassified Flavobacterium]UMY65772.1 sulfatase-like hydrolase/transferase [Flavobacterium sp. HJ-32-4]
MFQFLRRSGRFAVLAHFLTWFVVTSSVVRIALLIWQSADVSWAPLDILRTLGTGLLFDVATAFYAGLLPTLYFCFFPNRWVGSLFDRVMVWFFTSLAVFILVFAFFAEFTFWEEFRSRFNFIAVDYLIYTHEVVANIQESYPLPLLVGAVVALTVLFLFLFWRNAAFTTAFRSKARWNRSLALALGYGLVVFLCTVWLRNTDAEWSPNRYNSELSKTGVYSFFSAFRNNQMKYTEFYTSIDNKKAFQLVRSKLQQETSVYSSDGFSIHRKISNSLDTGTGAPKNVVFILVESLSGSFLQEFGNEKHITPFLDSLAQKSVFFSNMYATGTRTVRGMEAVTLCIPPTPGQSIVKRPENGGLYTVGSVFEKRGYVRNFFYGGDGYFDNMNAFYGGNGFTIYDRGRGSVLSDAIKTTRHNITDGEVTFENAWGICDEDIYRKMLSVADAHYARKEPFFNFIMTTSNHRPYTYPSGKIDIPSGTSRDGAVKYTDFALRELFAAARKKPWFQNTVFVIVADHCASSAGKDEIDVKNYHIPALIVNLPAEQNGKIAEQCSQIDLFPTFFGLLGWSYESDFYGKDVRDAAFEERSFVGTYRKLALMKGDRIMILSDQKKKAFYRWDRKQDRLLPLQPEPSFLEETIAWYQTADYLFTNKLLK